MISGQNHTMKAGNTKTISVPCTVGTTTTAVDFSGATLTGAWTAKKNGTTYITKTPTASGGTLSISLATGDTSSLSGKYSHECTVTLADGTVTTLFCGDLIVEALL